MSLPEKSSIKTDGNYTPSDEEITAAYDAKIAAGYDPKDLGVPPNPSTHVPTDEEITKAISER